MRPFDSFHLSPEITQLPPWEKLYQKLIRIKKETEILNFVNYVIDSSLSIYKS